MRTFDGGANLTVTVAGSSGVDGLISVTGDCTSSPCALTMDSDKSVTAQFVRYACAPNTETCANGMYTQCDATGNFVSHVIPNGMNDGTPTTITMNGYACPMGCHANQPRCADITLGNGVELAMDTAGVSPTGMDIVLPGPNAPDGTITISTNAFNTTTGLLQITDTDGATRDIPGQIIEQGGEAGAVLVLKARTFSLRSGSVLRVSGARSFGVASHFDTYIAGTIDASANGPGGRGFTASCRGGGIGTIQGATGGAGGACAGGASSTGVAGGPPSSVQAPFITGGCPGGVGTAAIEVPGIPGGGVFLASRTRVHLASTAIIDLTAGGGAAGNSTARGGGSGGNAVVMAPLVRGVAGSAIVSRGSSGSAGGNGEWTIGLDGPVSGPQFAAGVTCPTCGTSGTGGYETSCNGGTGTGSGLAVAGGGGAAGACAIYSLTGAADVSTQATKCVRQSQPLQPRSP